MTTFDEKEFKKMLANEKGRGDAITALASCILLTPAGSKIYEDADDPEEEFKDTITGLLNKTDSKLLKEARALGIVE